MKNLKKIIFAGLFLALTLLLPFLTGQIPQIGQMISPMHIPVLICGFVCGWPYGLVVGFIAPILRSLLFTMPPMFPHAIAMAVELAFYGLATGILYKLLPKKNLYIYVNLIISMLVGRVAWGLTMTTISMVSTVSFTFEMFMLGAFVNAVMAIIIHILIIPPIIIGVKKVGYILNE